MVDRYELFALSFLAIISSVTLSALDDMVWTLESYITAYDSNGDRFIVEEKSAVSSNFVFTFCSSGLPIMSDERKLYLVAMVFFVNSSACHFFLKFLTMPCLAWVQF